MKIVKLSFFAEEIRGAEAVKALRATFVPFASLTEGVEGEELARTILVLVSEATLEGRCGLAADILRELWMATTDQVASLELAPWTVILRTPTSGTKIVVRRSAGGYGVEVDFGLGSENRAQSILAAAQASGVHFDVE